MTCGGGGGGGATVVAPPDPEPSVVAAFWSPDAETFFTLNADDGTAVSVEGERDGSGMPVRATAATVASSDGASTRIEFDDQLRVTRQVVAGQGTLDIAWPLSGTVVEVLAAPLVGTTGVRVVLDLSTMEVLDLFPEVIAPTPSPSAPSWPSGALALQGLTTYTGTIETRCDGAPFGPEFGVSVTAELRHLTTSGTPFLVQPLATPTWNGVAFEYDAEPGLIDPTWTCDDFESVLCPATGPVDAATQAEILALVCGAILLNPGYDASVGTLCISGAASYQAVLPVFCNGLCPLIDTVITDLQNDFAVQAWVQRTSTGVVLTDTEGDWDPPTEDVPDFAFDLTSCDPGQIVSTSTLPTVVDPCAGYALAVNTFVSDLPLNQTATVVATIFRDGDPYLTQTVTGVPQGAGTVFVPVLGGPAGVTDTFYLTLVSPGGSIVDTASAVEVTLGGCLDEIDLSGGWVSTMVELGFDEAFSGDCDATPTLAELGLLQFASTITMGDGDDPNEGILITTPLGDVEVDLNVDTDCPPVGGVYCLEGGLLEGVVEVAGFEGQITMSFACVEVLASAQLDQLGVGPCDVEYHVVLLLVPDSGNPCVRYVEYRASKL